MDDDSEARTVLAGSDPLRTVPGSALQDLASVAEIVSLSDRNPSLSPATVEVLAPPTAPIGRHGNEWDSRVAASRFVPLNSRPRASTPSQPRQQTSNQSGITLPTPRPPTQPHTLQPLDHRREPNQTLTHTFKNGPFFWHTLYFERIK